MRGARLGIALFLGVVITLAELAAVGALNLSRTPEEKSKAAPKTPPPMIVSRSPRAPVALPSDPAPVRAKSPKQAKAVAHLRTSALPAFRHAHSGLGLLTVLPGLEGAGLASVGVPELASEPDRPARVRRTPDPVYPAAAQRDGIEGYVVVRLSIDAQGKVTNVLIVDSDPMGIFERSARNAARRFEFHPARLDGSAVATTVQKKIVFTLK